jgi:uncharacterized protein YecE (DUF72 family)
VFSAKLPRLITHKKRLDPEKKVKSDLNRFLELLEPLNSSGKLGCILIQLPPSFIYDQDIENLKAFLEMIPNGYHFAAEFRNHSWMRNETWKILEKNNIAYCIVDEPLLPPEIHITANFAFFRWHGKGTNPWYNYRYSDEELQEWIPRIKEVKDKVDKIYGYFNNHYHGYAVENCIEILEMLNIATPNHKRAKEKIINYSLRNKKLDDFGFGIKQESIEGRLFNLTEIHRFERGKSIDDKEIDIQINTDSIIEATISNYIIKFDLNKKIISHDCVDWVKGLGMKRLCKHIVKFFLFIPKVKAKKILTDLEDRKKLWIFEKIHV